MIGKSSTQGVDEACTEEIECSFRKHSFQNEATEMRRATQKIKHVLASIILSHSVLFSGLTPRLLFLGDDPGT